MKLDVADQSYLPASIGAVYLVPLGNPESYSAEEFAEYFHEKLGINVTALPWTPLMSFAIDETREQAIAEELIKQLRQLPKVAKDQHVSIIGITERDMYIRSYDWDFAFNYRDDEHFGVVSSARLNPMFYGQVRDDSLLKVRLRKLLAKNIGILHFGLSLSDDPTSVLYDSITSVEDLDTVREDFAGLGSRAVVNLVPSTHTAAPLTPKLKPPIAQVPVSDGHPCLVVEQKASPSRKVPRLDAEITTCHLSLGNESPVDRYEVDLTSGMFVLRKTDLFLPDTPPLALTRTYRPWDEHSRAFGIGTNHPYDIFPVGSRFPFTFIDLILADGSHVHYDRISAGGDYRDALYEHSVTNSLFYKSQIRWNGKGWDLKFTDGGLYQFPDSYYATNSAQGAPTEIRDSQDNEIRFMRDSARNLLRLTSPHDHWIKFTYDSDSKIVEATDNRQRTVRYFYDAGRRLIRVVGSEGDEWQYTYDSDMMLSVRTGGGTTVLENRYKGGRVAEEKLADGRVYRFHYSIDPSDNVTSTAVTSPSGKERTFEISQRSPVGDERR